MELPAERLYKLYSGWTGQLNAWCLSRLGRHIDAEFFPIDWTFKVYSGHARPQENLFGLPNLERPEGEKSFKLKLPTPEEDPSQERLDECFKNICLAVARVLEIDLGAAKLGRGHKNRALAAPDPSHEQPSRPRLGKRKPQLPGARPKGSGRDDAPLPSRSNSKLDGPGPEIEDRPPS